VAGAVTPAGNGSEPPAQKAAQAQAGAGRPAGDVPARRPTISRYRLVMLFTIVAGLVMMAWSNLPTGGRHPATAQPAASGPAADRPDALNRTGTAPAPPVPSMSGQPHDLPTSSRTPASTGTSTTLSPTGATTTTQSVPTTGSTVGTVFTSQGGTATAVCEAASQVHLTGYDPARSYSVSTADTGPAAQAQVVFRHGNTLVQMTFSCSGGMPTEVTTVR
jgi:serine/threonine-protein kinase